MRYIKKIIGLVIFCFFCLNVTAGIAGEPIEVVKAEGKLTLSDATGSNQKTVRINDKLPPSNILTTGTDGRAVVRVGKTGYIVMEKNSQVEIDTANDRAGFFRHLTGVIYYGVNSLKDKDHTLEVRTKTATMGIRGTRFLVTDIPERSEVAMRKGTLSILSQNDEFEIHIKTTLDEFEALKRESAVAISEEKNQFKKYQENTQHEFVEYKREFTLEMDRMATFDGKRVDDRPLSGASKKDMETLEGYAEKWLSEIQD
jgi:hypothetical protein